MAKLVFIVGKSGRGKSTSCMYLDPESTAIVNSDEKDLPFPQFKKNYNTDKGNYIQTSEITSVIEFLKQQHKNPKIKTIVIDTWSRIMTDTVMSSSFKNSNDGMKKWANLAYDNYMLLKIINRNLREDIIVYVMCHPETVYDEMGISKEQISVQGQQLKKFVPESFSSIVLYAEAIKTPGQPVEFSFRTVTTGEDSCKAPMGMFEQEMIPNNLKIVTETINKYYQ